MGKTGKLRKKLKRERELNGGGSSIVAVPTVRDNGVSDGSNALSQPHTSELVAGVVDKHDLMIAIRVLRTLGNEPELYHRSEFKLLRQVVRPLVLEQAAMDKGSLGYRISEALKDARWDDAIALLEQMRAEGQVPKLGAFQRWVRDCDILGTTSVGVAENTEAIRLMDAILRVSAALHGLDVVTPNAKDATRAGRIEVCATWRPPLKTIDMNGATVSPSATSPPPSLPPAEAASMLQALAWPEERVKNQFRVVAHESGPKRIPPNEYDLRIYTSKPETMNWSQSQQQQEEAVVRHEVPFVPGAFVLANVFTSQECDDMVAAANGIGFTPDEPVGSRPGQRAQNVVWMVDSDTQGAIESRVRQHLPSVLDGAELGAEICLNPRFRLYRYIKGNVYRPHVDGAWPGSGFREEDGAYLYDAYEGKLWSRLTFLIYLNEGMDGGCTTFYLPSKTEVGTVQAYGVQPTRGSVLVFPHGGSCGSLVHEGSAVVDGIKYVIRTDVLYTVPEDMRASAHLERRAKRHHHRQSAGIS